jgi:hypothetical protein
MIKKGKMPITGRKTQMGSTPNIKTNPNDPSAQAERMVKQSPQPFQNPNGSVKSPVGTGPKGAVPGPVSNQTPGRQRSAAPKNPAGGAVGYSKLPNQSKQIGGRFGQDRPRKVGNPKNQPSAKKHAAFYGG